MKCRATLSGFSRWIFWSLCRESHFGLTQFFWHLAMYDPDFVFWRLTVNYFDILSSVQQWIIRYFVCWPTANFLDIISRVLGPYLYILSILCQWEFYIAYRARLYEFFRYFWGVLRRIFWITSWFIVGKPHLISTWNILDMIFWKNIIG